MVALDFASEPRDCFLDIDCNERLESDVFGEGENNPYSVSGTLSIMENGESHIDVDVKSVAPPENRRFGFEWFTQEGDHGSVYLRCQWRPGHGVFYRGELVLSETEVGPFFKSHEFPSIGEDEEDSSACHQEKTERDLFEEENAVQGYDWYRFYCSPETLTTETMNRTLVKPQGFPLRDDQGVVRWVGVQGAYVDILVGQTLPLDHSSR